jgi:hypothetical protein
MLRRREDGKKRDGRDRSLDECRAPPWFQRHPEVVDRLESVLTKFYLANEGAEWQAVWEQLQAIFGQRTDTPVDRCRALAVVLQGVKR